MVHAKPINTNKGGKLKDYTKTSLSLTVVKALCLLNPVGTVMIFKKIENTCWDRIETNLKNMATKKWYLSIIEENGLYKITKNSWL